MRYSPAQLAEFDEVLKEPIISTKGDIAYYKVNHYTKQVWIRTGVDDGNSQEWKATNGGYYQIMQRIGKHIEQPVTNTVDAFSGQTLKPLQSNRPIDIVDPFNKTVINKSEDN